MHGHRHRYSFCLLFGLMAWFVGTEAPAQTVIDFRDSVTFHRRPRTDTIDNDYLTVTPYPDSVDLDLDCNSVADVRLKCYKTPLPNLPQAHHIVIRPLAGSGVQILADGAIPKAFRRDTMLVVDSLNGWSALPEYQILYFSVISGASWAGVAGTDSVTVTDRSVVFRKEEGGTLRYGWIAYDGVSWPARLSVRETGWSGSGCQSVGTEEEVAAETHFLVWPNPAARSLQVEADERAAELLMTDALGLRSARFPLHAGRANIDLSGTPAGLHILRLLDAEGRPFGKTQKIIMVLE